MKIIKTKERYIEEKMERFNEKKTTKYKMTKYGDEWTLDKGLFEGYKMEIENKKARIYMYKKPEHELKEAILEFEKITRYRVFVVLK